MYSRRQTTRILLASWATLLSGLSIATADVPRLIHYQGKLVTTTGALVAGPVDIRARLYGHPTNPTPLFLDETHSSVQLSNGLFGILLGSVAPGGLPDSALVGTDCWLEVSIGTTTLSPRIRVATAPYSVKAKAAEQLVKPGTMTPGVSLTPTGNVGIGTTAPDPSALLELSSTSGGFTLPRLTTAQRDAISNPMIGLMVFNTTTNCINMYNGSTWKQSCFDCSFNAPTAGNNSPICQGATLNLSATSILGASYAWTGPNGFSAAIQNPSIPNVQPAASGPYSVTATVSGCTSSPMTTLVTINNTPAQPTVGNNSPICTGLTLNLTASSVPGGVYSWSGPNGFASNAQNPSISNVTAAAAGTYTLNVSVNGCAAPAATTNVVINPPPATPGTITGTSTVCTGDTGKVYAISAVPTATGYAWTAPAGATITAGQGTTSATVSFGSTSGDISVTASNACGTSSAALLPITVVSIPATPGTISGSTSLCAGASGQQYTISDVFGATSYTWTVPAGATVTAGQGTAFATVTFGGASGNVSVTANNSCGASAPRTLAVTIAGGSGSQTFNATGSGASGSIQTFTVPTCVTSLTVETWGAQGGGTRGGKGARMRGTFPVSPGDVLKVLVGQRGIGGGDGSGGGGGSVVATNANVALLVAGGGGGAPNNYSANPESYGGDGQTTTSGTAGKTATVSGNGAAAPGGSAGSGGNGGGASYSGCAGSGGGGFNGNGVSGYSGNPNAAGQAFVNGGAGGTNGSAYQGGFGGGGAGSDCNGGTGGAGGYSGGGEGGAYSGAGGGGGSYNNGSNQSNTAGVQTGDGQVVITW